MNELETEQRHLELIVNMIDLQKTLAEIWIIAAMLFLAFFAQRWWPDSHLYIAGGILAGGVSTYLNHGRRMKVLHRRLDKIEERILSLR